MAYASLAQVKAYLGNASSADDTLLNDIIARAHSIINRYCGGRIFEWTAAAEAKTFDAIADVDGRELLFYRHDLAEISSVVNGDGVTVSAGEYVTLPANGAPYYGLRLKASSGKAWTYTTDPEGAISVTGKWAYSVACPADITAACVRLVAYLYRQKDTQQVFQQMANAQTGVMALPSEAIPSDIKTMLAPYRKVL